MINVQMIDFGNSIPEAVCKNEDGSYSIFLNTRLSHEKNIESYHHAISHILHDDLDSDETADLIERRAHCQCAGANALEG